MHSLVRIKYFPRVIFNCVLRHATAEPKLRPTVMLLTLCICVCVWTVHVFGTIRCYPRNGDRVSPTHSIQDVLNRGNIYVRIRAQINGFDFLMTNSVSARKDERESAYISFSVCIREIIQIANVNPYWNLQTWSNWRKVTNHAKRTLWLKIINS